MALDRATKYSSKNHVKRAHFTVCLLQLFIECTFSLLILKKSAYPGQLVLMSEKIKNIEAEMVRKIRIF